MKMKKMIARKRGKNIILKIKRIAKKRGENVILNMEMWKKNGRRTTDLKILR